MENRRNAIDMRATGIVRRIDDLGRVVVPKEIRRTLRIREGDPLEIFTDREGEIILKKYSPIGELGQFAGEYAESLSQATGHLVCITDRDHVIAASGQGKREFENKPISKQLEMMIEDRKNVVASKGEKEFVKITSVVLYNRDEKCKMGETESKLVSVAAGFLGRQMEQ